jgi:hypothetical protein
MLHSSDRFPWMVPYRYLQRIGFKFQIRIVEINFLGLAIGVTLLIRRGGGGGGFDRGYLVHQFKNG